MSQIVKSVLYVGHNIQLVKAIHHLSDTPPIQTNYSLSHLNSIDDIQAVLAEKKYTHFICEMPVSQSLVDQIESDFPLLKTSYMNPIAEEKVPGSSVVMKEFISEEIKAALDYLSLPIYFKNKKGQFLTFNRHFEMLFDVSTEQLLGKMVEDLLPAHIASDLNKLDQQLFEDRQAHFYPCCISDGGGKKRDVVFRKECIAKHDLQIGMIFDVTDINQTKLLLEQERMMLRATMDISSDLIFFKDLQSRFLGCNKEFEKFVGCSEQAILGKKDEQLFELEQALMCQSQDKHVISRNKIYFNKEYLTYKSGDRHFIEMKKVPLRNKQGDAQGLICVGRDVTASQRVLRSLKIANSVFENSRENIIVTDETGKIISVNKSLCMTSGFSKKELLHAHISIFESNQFERVKAALQDKNSWQGDVSFRLKNGDVGYGWVDVYTVDHSDEGIRNRIYSVTGFKQSQNLKEKIQFLSTCDPLTGLFNRIALFTRLEDAIRRARYKELSMAVILVDINGFKSINDQFGHNAGDLVLKEIAMRIKNCVFEKDTVARFGDDEFVIVVDEVDSEQDGAIIAQKIATQFRHKFVIDNIDASLSATIGISIFPDDGASVDALLLSAEKAMQRGKKDKSVPYHFYTMALTRHSTEQLKLEDELKLAVEQDQFEIYYQPQYDLSKRQIVAVEGIFCWNHPTKGLLQPDRFCILAENCNLLVPLALKMIRKAAIQAVLWEKQDIKFGRIAIDLCEVQLSQISFIADLQTIFLDTKCAHHYLEFGVDEVVFASSCAIVHENIQNIRKLGISLIITNYAAARPALDYVENLHIEKLKISKKWIKNLPNDYLGQVLIDKLILIAHSLGMDIVGDGVDNIHNNLLLSEQGLINGEEVIISDAMKASAITFYLRCNKRK